MVSGSYKPFSGFVRIQQRKTAKTGTLVKKYLLAEALLE